MSRIPSVRPPEWAPPKVPTREYKISVVTPMFGGGAKAKTVDADYPIRAAAIRGALRFWWRTVYGGSYRTSAALFAAEEKLWGSMNVPGRIALTVTLLHKGDVTIWAEYEQDPNDRKKFKFKQRRDFPLYAVFPFKGRAEHGKIEELPASAQVGVEFSLIVSADDASLAEAEAAVHAWLLFGGVGSRTRRGCGSLKLDDGLPSINNLTMRPASHLIPGLAGSQLAQEGVVADATTAWKNSVKLYNDFRQKEDFARNRGQESNRPGRSRWPEPDAIRRLTGRFAPQHAPKHAVENGFPRADLGLPIVFHFQGGGDPQDAILQGAPGKSRMASPVITKAVQCKDGFLPTLLILNAPHVWEGTKVEILGRPIGRESIELTPAERGKVQPLNGDDVRAALLNYAESNGWKRSMLS